MSPRRGRRRLRTGQALALGALQGPAELLPISSSGHLALVPWLLRWDYTELDPELRKSFEVALHAGTAAALLIGGAELPGLELLVLSSLPPAIAGYLLERRIERQLGGPRSVVAGLLGGALAMAAADRREQGRARSEVDPADALLLGLAQACALVPGVSRSGATLTAARARRFTRADAARLSTAVGLPVLAGAALLKGVRLSRRGLPQRARTPFAAGAAAAFASTLAARRLAHRDGPLLPFALYRIALATAALSRTIGR